MAAEIFVDASAWIAVANCSGSNPSPSLPVPPFNPLIHSIPHSQHETTSHPFAQNERVDFHFYGARFACPAYNLRTGADTDADAAPARPPAV